MIVNQSCSSSSNDDFDTSDFQWLKESMNFARQIFHWPCRRTDQSLDVAHLLVVVVDRHDFHR